MKQGARYTLIIKRDRAGKWRFLTGGAGADRNKWIPLSGLELQEIIEMMVEDRVKGE